MPSAEIARSVGVLHAALARWSSKHLERAEDWRLVKQFVAPISYPGMPSPAQIPMIYHNNNKTQEICALAKIDGTLHARIAEECSFTYEKIAHVINEPHKYRELLNHILADINAMGSNPPPVDHQSPGH